MAGPHRKSSGTSPCAPPAPPKRPTSRRSSASWVAPEERTVIARHVLDCLRCTAELRSLRAFLSGDELLEVAPQGLLAGINAIPPELFECAALESKSPWRRFWLVTVPLLKPFLALGVFLSLTSAFANLANVWMLTAGRIVFPVIGTHAYWLAIKGGQFGPASALSLTLVPLLLGALLVLFRLFDPGEEQAA